MGEYNRLTYVWVWAMAPWWAGPRLVCIHCRKVNWDEVAKYGHIVVTP